MFKYAEESGGILLNDLNSMKEGSFRTRQSSFFDEKKTMKNWLATPIDRTYQAVSGRLSCASERAVTRLIDESPTTQPRPYIAVYVYLF